MSIFDFFKKKGAQENNIPIIENKNYVPISKQEEWQAYYFVEGKKNRKRRKASNIILVGLGGSGSVLVNQLFQETFNNVLCGVINKYNLDFIDANITFKYELYYDGKEVGYAMPTYGYISTQSYFDSLYDNGINLSWLRGLLSEPVDKVVLVLGFGGQFSAFLANWICRMNKEYTLPIYIIGSLPFIFEGEKRKKAQEQIDSIEELGYKVIKIDAENIYELYNDVNYYNCFSYLDKISC